MCSVKPRGDLASLEDYWAGLYYMLIASSLCFLICRLISAILARSSWIYAVLVDINRNSDLRSMQFIYSWAAKARLRTFCASIKIILLELTRVSRLRISGEEVSLASSFWLMATNFSFNAFYSMYFSRLQRSETRRPGFARSLVTPSHELSTKDRLSLLSLISGC